MKEIQIDAVGLACPAPVIKTLKEMEKLSEHAVIETHVDNSTAVENLLIMAKGKGLSVLKETISEKHYKVRIEVDEQYVLNNNDNSGSNQAPKSQEVEKRESAGDAKSKEHLANTEGVVVVFGSELMGDGSEELGKILIKGFIYSLTELPTPPKALLFYNSGAKLTTQGTQVEDLKILEEKGVEILTCGTCLDYYNMKDQLAVGSVSNMYTIVETMEKAAKIIKP